MDQQARYIQEDEIDLKELFQKIWTKRVFILVFTFMVTFAAGVYAFVKTPIYEAKALIELGSYKLDNSNNNSVLIDNANQLVQKLTVLYIDAMKNIKERQTEITAIQVPKNQTNFIEITSNAISNDLAKKEILGVIDYITKNHTAILEEVKQRRELQINNIDRKIQNIKSNEIKLLEERISLQTQTIKDLNTQLAVIDKNIKQIEQTNPTLSALKLMEKRDLSNFILKVSEDLMETKSKKDSLETSTLSELEEEKNLIRSLLLPHNYQNTQVVGEILTNDHPAKPKKKLIIVVAFVTGLILSIFLVFFLDFVRSMRE